MKTKIMYGAPVVEALENLNKHLISTFEVKPKLGIITVNGGDDASKVYVRNKLKAAERVGITAYHYQTTVDELLRTIRQAEEECDGVIIQRPFGESSEVANEQHYCDAINLFKDADRLGYKAKGKFYTDELSMAPCTPLAVMALLTYYDIQLQGKTAVVIGRSDLVGRPLAELLLRSNATVTVCHSKTPKETLKKICKQADIIVCAASVPKLLTRDMVKKGAAVVDVSINRDADGKLCGDADFENLIGKVAAITPVPKGIGPITVAELMTNTVTLSIANNFGK